MFQALPMLQPVMEAAADMSLASIHADLGRPDDAEAESRRALETVENIYCPNDVQTAWLLLARAAYELKAPKHGRETMADFRHDWKLLNMGRAETEQSPAYSGYLLQEPHRYAAVAGGR